jgi:hypothetical protein
MVSLQQKSVLSAALGLALLLLGGANLFSVSVDNDGDDETPPITVEFNFIASSKKAIQAEKEEAVRHKTENARSEALRHRSASLDGKSVTGSISISPQVVVPLRT